MKKFICTLCITTVMILFFAFPALANSFDKSLVPADAQWVLHVDMSLYKQTQLKKLMAEKNIPFLMENEADDFFKETNIKLQEDITSFTIFGTKKGEKDVVLVCTGNFDGSRLLAYIAKKQSLKKERYNRFDIHEAGQRHFLVFPGKNLFFYSSNHEALKKALDVLDRKKKDISAATLMNYINMIPANAFLMAAANDVSAIDGPSSRAGAILANTGMATFMVMEKNTSLQLNILLNTLNTQTAQNIEQIIKGLIAVGSMQKQAGKQNGKEELFKLLNAIKINKDGNTLRLSLDYPTAALVELMAKKNHHSNGHKTHSRNH